MSKYLLVNKKVLFEPLKINIFLHNTYLNTFGHCLHVTGLTFFKGSKDPNLTIPVEGPKVTAALWGPLDQYIITGHENGDLCQWDTKV